jgi:hypothetical protein
MGRTDPEIAETLNEIRLEAALAIEIQRTAEIIKQTHLFDKVDRIFGEPGAKYSATPPGQDGGMGGLGGGGGAPAPMMGDDFGSDLDGLGEPGEDTEGDLGGDEGGADLGGMDAEAPGPLNEVAGFKPMSTITESIRNAVAKGQFYNAYVKGMLKEEEDIPEPIPILDKNLRINEQIESILKSIGDEKNTSGFTDDEIEQVLHQ